MADNLAIKDGAGAARTVAAKDVSSVHVPRHNLVSEANVALIGQAAMAASLPVVIASDQSTVSVSGSAASGAADSGNPVKAGGRYNTTKPTLTDGQRGDLQMDSRGGIYVALKSENSTGTAAITVSADGRAGSNGVVAIAEPHKWNGTTWDRDRKPNATSRIVSAANTTNATSAKASAGDLHTVHGLNAAAAVRYLKFYNKASAPTVGTDVPILTIAIGASQAFRFDFNGHYFSTGIAYALTTGSADADTGALTAGDILGLSISYA